MVRSSLILIQMERLERETKMYNTIIAFYLRIPIVIPTIKGYKSFLLSSFTNGHKLLCPRRLSLGRNPFFSPSGFKLHLKSNSIKIKADTDLTRTVTRTVTGLVQPGIDVWVMQNPGEEALTDSQLRLNYLVKNRIWSSDTKLSRERIQTNKREYELRF